MKALTDSPILVFAVALLGLSLSARLGAAVTRRRGILDERVREDFGVVLAATLTLLGLIIGFSFSIYVSMPASDKAPRGERRANVSGTEVQAAD